MTLKNNYLYCSALFSLVYQCFILIPGFPPEGQAKGCQECQDQEELRVHQIQGSMLPIPLHPRHQGQGEGREVEAIAASRSSS